MPIPRDIAGLAWTQGGCVSRAQLLKAGLTRRQIDRMVTQGELRRAAGMTYRVFPAKDWLDQVRGALVAIPGSVASHQTAAGLHHFPRVRAAPVITAHTRTTHRIPGITVVRSHDLNPEHVVCLEGIRTTTIPRTVFDLCAVLHPKHVRSIVGDLMIDRRVNVAELEDVLQSCARRGKPGVKTLRGILETMGPGVHPMSELERRGLAVVGRSGVAEPQTEYAIPWDRTRRFDLAWPEARVAVEWDSRRWHAAIEQMTFDRRRDRTAVAHGWVVLRFTWDDVTVRPHEIGEELRTILAQRRADR